MESILKKEINCSRVVLRVIAVMFFIATITLGAYVRIPLPFTPVPLTLQTFFVLLSSAFLGIKLGLFTQFFYIFLGLIGIPVFTGEFSGALYLLGPTAGYLLGFIFATIFIPNLLNRLRASFLLVILVFSLASILILLFGVIWLKISLSLSWASSFLIGFAPFIPGDLVKSIIASLLFCRLKPRVGQIL
jgi:biotin transport system substrate-specific component